MNRAFVFAGLVLASIAAHAQLVYPPNPALIESHFDTIAPYHGTYYDPAQSGTGIQVDVGAGGNAFVTYYSYNADGTTTWYIVQGVYQPSSELARWNTGVIGTMSGPFYQAFHGQCLGCAFTPTGGAVATAFTANLAWTDSRAVTMTVGNQSWHFIAPNLDGASDGDTLVGNWTIHVLQQWNGLYGGSNLNGTGGIFDHDSFATITIAKQATGNAYTLTHPNLSPITPQADIYTWSCSEFPPKPPQSFGCDPTMTPLSLTWQTTLKGNLVFWYDPTLHKLGADVVTGGAIGPQNMHIDLYQQTPNLIIGRGIVEGTAGNIAPGPWGLYQDGALATEVVMQRIPSGSTGNDYIEPQP